MENCGRFVKYTRIPRAGHKHCQDICREYNDPPQNMLHVSSSLIGCILCCMGCLEENSNFLVYIAPNTPPPPPVSYLEGLFYDDPAVFSQFYAYVIA